MRFDKNDIMYSSQLYTLLGSSIVGTGILTLARAVSEVAGRDGWISTFIGGMVALFSVIIIVQLGKRFPNETFIEYTNKITGKYIAFFIVLIYIVFALATSSIVIRILIYLLNTWLLRYTPRYVFSLLIVPLCVYLSRNGIKVLARFAELSFFILLPLAILIFIPLGAARTFTYIRPIGYEGIVNILKGALPAVFAYSGFEIILIYFPFVTPKKNVMKASIWSIISVTLLYTTTVAAQIIVFPQTSIREMWAPTVNYILNVRVPFIQRVDILFIFFWIIAIFNTAAIQYYTATVEITQLFNLKDRKKVSVFIAPIVFILSLLPQNIVIINKITDIISKFGLLVIIIIPLILLFLSVVLSRRGEDFE